MERYAYIRVSSKDQNVARQVVAMRKEGIKEKNMFIDKQSGKDFDRKEYQRMIKKLKPGDELYIKHIDRLGRNYEEILEQWRYLIKEKEIDIIVMEVEYLDTRHKVMGLTTKFMADMVLQILSFVADIERQNRKQNQLEGIQIAKANGVKFGRPRREIPENFDEVYSLYAEKAISKREAARRLNTNHNTFTNWIKRLESAM